MRVLNMALVCAMVAAWGVDADTTLPKGILTTDAVLTQAALTDEIGGHIVEYSDGTHAFYGRDGQFIYTLRKDIEPFTGRYSFGADGQVCLTYDAGLSRCDTYVHSDEGMVLVHPSGHRFLVTAAYPS